MKFGKQLRLLTKEEFRNDTIDYKLLKKIIAGEAYDDASIQRARNPPPPEEGDDDSDGGEDVGSRRSLQLPKRSKKKVMERQRSLSQLAMQQAAAAGSQGGAAEPAARTPPPATPIEFAPITRRREAFLRTLIEEVLAAERRIRQLVEKHEAAAKRLRARVTQLPEQLDELAERVRKGEAAAGAAGEPAGVPAGADSPAKGAPPQAPAAAAAGGAGGDSAPSTPAELLRSVLKRMRRLDQRLEDAKDFARVNIMAVDKITKKWDKRVKAFVEREGPSATQAGWRADHHPDPPSRFNAVTSLSRDAPIRDRWATIMAASPLSTAAAAFDCVDAAIDSMVQSLPPLPSTATPVETRAKWRQRQRPAQQQGIMQAPVHTVSRLNLDALPVGRTSRLYVAMGTDPLSQPVRVPVIVARGARPGPTLGITSAIHGNEVAGIAVIHLLLDEVLCDLSEVSGTVIFIPVLNVEGYTRFTRGFRDGQDLNRLMPGRKDGNASAQYAYRILDRLISPMDYLIDLHTASFGRVNSLYVRADMSDPEVARLALLVRPQIIVHNDALDGRTLRGVATQMGCKAITIEIGNPQRFSRPMIHQAFSGIADVFGHLRIVPLSTTAAVASGSGALQSAHPRVWPGFRSTVPGTAGSGADSAGDMPAIGLSPQQQPSQPGQPQHLHRSDGTRGPPAVGLLATAGEGAPVIEFGISPARVVNIGVAAAAEALTQEGVVTPVAGDNSNSHEDEDEDEDEDDADDAPGLSTPILGSSTLARVLAPPLPAPAGGLEAVVCSRSKWIFARTGGVLYVFPPVASWVRKGECVAEIRSVFGHLVDRVFAPLDGVVVGKSENPVCGTGDRVIHLGIVGKHLSVGASDGHA